MSTGGPAVQECHYCHTTGAYFLNDSNAERTARVYVCDDCRPRHRAACKRWAADWRAAHPAPARGPAMVSTGGLYAVGMLLKRRRD